MLAPAVNETNFMKSRCSNKHIAHLWWRSIAFCALAPIVTLGWAHDVSRDAQARMSEGGILNYMLTGADHMLTGYDHLLFLLGVVFFLRQFTQIVKFVTAFTLGHTVVLLGATFAGISADHYLIDAFIAATVIYKGFENLGGFERLLGFKPPPLLWMVFLFGLVHGFGLSAQLQTLTLADDTNLAAKIIWFNVGVELGQLLALCVMVPVIGAWRKTTVWLPLNRCINAGLMVFGLLLLLFHLHGFVHESKGHEINGHEQSHSRAPSSADSPTWHSHGDDAMHFH